MLTKAECLSFVSSFFFSGFSKGWMFFPTSPGTDGWTAANEGGKQIRRRTIFSPSSPSLSESRPWSDYPGYTSNPLTQRLQRKLVFQIQFIKKPNWLQTLRNLKIKMPVHKQYGPVFSVNLFSLFFNQTYSVGLDRHAQLGRSVNIHFNGCIHAYNGYSMLMRIDPDGRTVGERLPGVILLETAVAADSIPVRTV